MNIWLSEIWRAWRASVRKPGFLLLATGVLTLGIGASAGAFTLVENVLLKPLPFTDAQQLVLLEGSNGPHSTSGISPRQYDNMRPLRGVASMGLIRDPVMGGDKLVDVGSHGRAVMARQVRVSAGLLHTLGLSMAAGHGFRAKAYAGHGLPVVLLGHAFWMHRYGGDPSIVGKQIRVGGAPQTVVGVLPAGFARLNRADVVRPLSADAALANRAPVYFAVARLDGSRDAAAVAAQANARVLAAARASGMSARQLRQLERTHIKAFAPHTLLNRDSADTVIGLFQVCGLVLLLVALVNLVNLMVMRASTNAHALAVRGSLGAKGLRLILPVLAEGLLVGLLGSLAGLGLGRAGIAVLRHRVQLPRLAHADLHLPPIVWLLAVGGGVAISLLAAWLGQHYARRGALADELREGTRSGSGRRAGRLGRALVVVQVVFATAGLMATAMVGHAVWQASTGPTGFDANGVLVFKTRPPAVDNVGPTAQARLARQVRHRLRAVPGVTSATITTHLPARPGHHSAFPVNLGGGNQIPVVTRAVDSAYFRTVRTPLLDGRTFKPSDLAGSARVVIINRHLALEEFGGHAVGQLLGTGASARRIVGVVGDVGRAGRRPRNQMYIPLTHRPGWLAQGLAWSVAVRVHGKPAGYRKAVRKAMAQVAPDWPVAHLRSLRQVVHDADRAGRRNMALVGLLAGLTLLLAAAGQYAVMMSQITDSEREFGIRMALGASPARLLRWVMGSGMRRIVLGLVIGVAFGVLMCLLMRDMIVLLGRSPIDGWAIGGTCLVMIVAGLLACLIPALRAAGAQPMFALRGE